MAASSESDHSDIFDSTSDLQLVIGLLDRKLKISERDDDDDDDKANNKSQQAQPQSDYTPSSIASSSSSSNANATATDTVQPTVQLNKEAFANRSLSSSSSSLNDDPGGGGQDGNGGGSSCVLQRAAMEIIESESSYVSDLQQVIEGYLHDWKERACLKLDELDTLFCNIEQLYAVNSQLNDRLKDTDGNVSLIAQCFLDLRDEFIVYTTYCTRYPDAIALLTRLLQSTHTNSLLTSTQKVLNHTLPLGSFLLKPVQRILKYHLLLDNLRKHCNVPEVNEAHQQMLKVARDIDQMKKALEQKGRVRQLCGILDGWLGPELTVLGDLRHEGVLFNNNKPREVFLFDTMLIIAKQKEDRRLQFKTYIHRKDMMLVEQIPGEPCSFFVIPYSDPRHQIKFVARNRNQKRIWAHHIKSVMLEDLNIPNRAKDLVFQLGDEEDVTSEKAIKKWGQTSTPEYLERRHRYRRSEIKERSAAVQLKRAAAKEAAASSSSLDTPQKDPYAPCCEDGKTCNCAIVKEQLKKDLTKKMLDSSLDEELGTPVNKYTTNAMPKRILNLKKTRSKTVPSSIFYRPLTLIGDSNDLTDTSSVQGKDNDEESFSVTGSHEQLLSRSASKDGDDREGDNDGAASRISSSSEVSASVSAKSECEPRKSRGKSFIFRASDSHLNYNKTTAAKEAAAGGGALMRSNTISSTEKMGSKGSAATGSKKNQSSLYKSWRSVKEEQQQESGKLSFHHLPGSLNLGERIANVDYVDPQRLFCLRASSSSRKLEGEGGGESAVNIVTTTTTMTTTMKTTITSGSGQRERDSVMSFTSSSDSVDESRTKADQFMFDRIGDDSYYEDNIERCLEDASLFRDSAIYSDDNDPRRVVSSTSSSGGGLETPPPVPYKPKHVTELQQKRLRELAQKRKLTTGGVAVVSVAGQLDDDEGESKC